MTPVAEPEKQPESSGLLFAMRGELLWTIANSFGADECFNQAMSDFAQALNAATQIPSAAATVERTAVEIAARCLTLVQSGLPAEAHYLQMARNALSWVSASRLDQPDCVALRLELARRSGDVSAMHEFARSAPRASTVSRRTWAGLDLLVRFETPLIWRQELGPFAPAIYAEVTGVDTRNAYALFSEPLPPVEVTAAGTRAFLWGHIIFWESAYPQAITMMHEAVHHAVRAGQAYKVKRRWLPRWRDVPTAAAQSYLMLLRDDEISIPKSIEALAAVGQSAVRDHSTDIERYVTAMLAYFDAHREESDACYVCAAILAGMVVELLPDESSQLRYVGHLEVGADHRRALKLASRGVELEL